MTWRTLVLVSMFGSSTALGATRAGVKMSGSTTVAGKKLVLNGMGVREATVFNVEVYVAGLYLEKKTSKAQEAIKGDTAKKLVLHFVRDVDYDDLADAFADGFEKNGAPGAMQPRVKKFVSWFTDVEEGHKIEMSYDPATGTTVKIRGKGKGTIEGGDFAEILYKIFVGPKPPNKSLREGLLGRG